MSKEKEGKASSVINGAPLIIGERVGTNGAINTQETWYAGHQTPEDLQNGAKDPPAIKSIIYEKGYKGEPLTHIISEGITPVIIIEPVGKKDGKLIAFLKRIMAKNNKHIG